MTRFRLASFVLFVGMASAAGAASMPYQAPTETAQFPPGPNLSLVRANCLVCHSADYVTTQPHSFKDPQAFWTGEVNKMKKAYGAPIQDADVPKLVAYLSAISGE